MSDQSSTAAEWRSNWTLVLAALAGMMLSALATGSIGVMMEPLEKEFGWSRTEIASGPALVSLVAMALATGVGLGIDRIGARRVGIAAAVLMCGAIALMASTSGALWHWLALWAIVGCAAAAMPTVWLVPISGAFTASRGLALAVVLSGTGLTNALVPMVTHSLVESHGWRTAYLGIAALWAVCVLPLVLLFFRGSAPQRRTASAPAPAELTGYTAREGFRVVAFWKLAAAAFLGTVAGVALVINLFPVLVSTGIDKGQAAQIAGLMGIATISGRLFGGWLMDRMSAAVIAATAAVLAAALPAALLLAPGSATAATVGIALYGLVGGAKIPAIAYLTSRHLGARAFGTLYGAINSGLALSVAIGPLAANAVYDATKSYDLVMWAAVPGLLIAAVLYLSLGAYPDFEQKQAD